LAGARALVVELLSLGLLPRINWAGGDFTFIPLADLGMKGASHVSMQDKSNLQVADFIIDGAIITSKIQANEQANRAHRLVNLA